jgi:hypothetical protein
MRRRHTTSWRRRRDSTFLPKEKERHHPQMPAVVRTRRMRMRRVGGREGGEGSIVVLAASERE